MKKNCLEQGKKWVVSWILLFIQHMKLSHHWRKFSNRISVIKVIRVARWKKPLKPESFNNQNCLTEGLPEEENQV